MEGLGDCALDGKGTPATALALLHTCKDGLEVFEADGRRGMFVPDSKDVPGLAKHPRDSVLHRAKWLTLRRLGSIGDDGADCGQGLLSCGLHFRETEPVRYFVCEA